MSAPSHLHPRRLIPFRKWPVHLRDHLIAAFDDRYIEDVNGEFLKELSPDTRSNYIAALSVFLLFLSQRGVDLALGWEVLLQPDWMWQFYLEQKALFEANNRSKTGKLRTAQDYFDRILAARLRLVPEQRDPMLEEQRRRERRQSRCESKRLVSPVDSQTLFQVAVSNLEHYRNLIETGRSTSLIYARYQTALQIGFLSQVPVRKKTLLMILLCDMQKADGRYVFHLKVPKNRGTETVTRENTEELTPYWEFFLEHVRPFFNPDATGAVWSEKNGTPLGQVNFTERFRRFIKREFDVHMRPHLVRHAGVNLAQALDFDAKTIAAVIQDLSTSTPELHYGSYAHSYSQAPLARLSRMTGQAIANK